MTERGEIRIHRFPTDARTMGSAALSVLLLASCSGESSEERPTVTHTVITTPPAESSTQAEDTLTEASSSPPEATTSTTETGLTVADCHSLRNYVGQYRELAYIEEIDDQLQALNGLYILDDSFRLRDNLTEFPVIMLNSFRDAHYAQALKSTVDDLKGGQSVDAQRFLRYEVMDIDEDICGDDYILERDMEAPTSTS